MSENYWDNSGYRPDLSKLPAPVREGMHQPFPMRPTELYCVLNIMAANIHNAGVNHPNARCNIVPIQKEGNTAISFSDGAQVEFTDFTGRYVLGVFFINKDNIQRALAALIRVYKGLGGDIAALLAEASEVHKVEASHIYAEERTVE